MYNKYRKTKQQSNVRKIERNEKWEHEIDKEMFGLSDNYAKKYSLVRSETPALMRITAKMTGKTCLLSVSGHKLRNKKIDDTANETQTDSQRVTSDGPMHKK